MVITLVKVLLIIAYVVANLVTAHFMSAKTMKRRFIAGQCAVGMVFANIFYAPAWILKGIRALIVLSIK